VTAKATPVMRLGQRGTIVLIIAALMLVGIPGTISIVRGTPLASCTGVGALANGSFEDISGTPSWAEYTDDQSNDNLFGSEPLQVAFVGQNLSSPGMNSWLTTASDSKIEVQRVREAGSYSGTVTASSATSATIQVADSDNAPFTGQDVRISGTRYNVSSGRTSLAVIADPYSFTIDTTSNAFTVGNSVTYAVVYSVSSTIDSLFSSTYFDYSTVEPAAGSFFAELNANYVSTLYQNVDTIAGTTLYWSIQHQGRSRSGNDVMKVKIGSTSSQTEQTSITKVVDGTTSSVSTISTGRGSSGTGWATYRGSYTVPSGQTTTRFAFESVSAALSASVGNFLDDISFVPLAACPLTRTAVAGTAVTINPFDTGLSTFAYAPTGTTITSASITSGSGSVTRTDSNTRLSFTPPSSAGSTVINYVLSYSQDGVASTSEGEITVTTSVQRPTIAWSSPTYGNDILDANCTTGSATQTTDGATRRIVFTAPSQTSSSTGCTFTPPSGVSSVEVLVVGGGGGGGGRFVGGGGGAGGLRTDAALAVTAGTSYSVTVGAGGAGGANSETAANAMGTTGSDSVFGSITAAGGGGGGGFVSTPGQAGRDGGSGGGGSGSATTTISGGTATPSGQGNNGGSGTVASGQNPGGGGGGAGGTGGNGGSSGGGAGGAGTSNNITGSFVTYAAGGGGGADSAAGGGAGGSSGVGGRGGNVNVAGAAGTSNTGSGGGGAGGGSGQAGGQGAAGIVILKYDLGTSTTVPAPGTATGTWSVTSSGGGVQSSGTAILQSAPYSGTTCGSYSDVGTATSAAAQTTAVNTCYRWTFDTALSAAASPPTDLAGNGTTQNLTSIVVIALSPTLTGPANQSASNNVSALTVGNYSANGFSGSSTISTSITISGVTNVTFSLPTTTGLTRTAGSSWSAISSVTFTSTRVNAVAALSAMTVATNANNGTAEITVTMTEGDASATDVVAIDIGWVGRLPATLWLDPDQTRLVIPQPNLLVPSVTNVAACISLSGTAGSGVIDISRSGGNAVGGNPDDGTGSLFIFGDQTRQVIVTGPRADVLATLTDITLTWPGSTSSLSDSSQLTIKFTEIPSTGLAFNCDNNHAYLLVDAGSNVSFTSAQSTSTGVDLTINGVTRSGYLATITSAIEQEIVDRLSLKPNMTTSDADHTYTAALGGTDATTEGVWCWVTGPEASGSSCTGSANSGTRFFVDATNSASLSGSNTCADGIRGLGACSAFPDAYQFWQSGEPNNGSGIQDYMQSGYCASTATCAWDDNGQTSSSNFTRYYIREYGSNTSGDFSPSLELVVQLRPLAKGWNVVRSVTLQ
jgi:hypothetical protein